MRVERVPCIGKMLEDIEILECLVDSDPDKLGLLRQLLSESDCLLFLWDSFAALPSSQFLDLLYSALLLDSRKSAVVLNRASCMHERIGGHEFGQGVSIISFASQGGNRC